MSVPKPKKMVSRSVAIALGIVSIIIVVWHSLFGAFSYYTPIINDKDKQITELDQQIVLMNTQRERLLGYLNDTSNSLKLTNSTIWSDNLGMTLPGGAEMDDYGVAYYVGYVKVEVNIPTGFRLTIEVIYSAHGVNYDYQQTGVGNATLVFSVLPAEITVKIPNRPSLNNSFTVHFNFTITYYY